MFGPAAAGVLGSAGHINFTTCTQKTNVSFVLHLANVRYFACYYTNYVQIPYDHKEGNQKK